MKLGQIAALVALFLLPCASSRATITIETVPVGNPGNAAAPNYNGQGRFGAVAYEYRIGTYEVTNFQYAAFLNAVAASDPLELYRDNMGSATFEGGITRSGVAGSYSYSVMENTGNKPVNYVSWYDAARFVNWLQNGQPVGPEGNGTTETGTYTLLGGTVMPTNATPPARNAGATWFLPTEDEWYKAAYYDPTISDYWTYPTRSNATPTKATANASGDISNAGANVANYDSGATWNSPVRHLTTVGSAGPASASYYGTYDQGGNIFEMNESLSTTTAGTGRGGAWSYGSTFLSKTTHNNFNISGSSSFSGFRVASSVPEPSAIVLAASIFAPLAACRRRRG